MSEGRELWDAVIVGGGLAGLTAAVYLGRSVENYLGFPEGLSSSSLLDRGRAQVRQFGPNIAAGQGVTGGQAIDRDLFDECLQCHRLPRMGTNEW